MIGVGDGLIRGAAVIVGEGDGRVLVTTTVFAGVGDGIIGVGVGAMPTPITRWRTGVEFGCEF